MTGQFSNNIKDSRFEYAMDGSIAFANYRKKNDQLFIDYVEAPQALRGTGAAGKLMEQIMDVAKQEKLKVTPICGYAATWMQRHKQDDAITGEITDAATCPLK